METQCPRCTEPFRIVRRMGHAHSPLIVPMCMHKEANILAARIEADYDFNGVVHRIARDIHTWAVI